MHVVAAACSPALSVQKYDRREWASFRLGHREVEPQLLPRRPPINEAITLDDFLRLASGCRKKAQDRDDRQRWR
jgi:hypothetical protein